MPPKTIGPRRAIAIEIILFLAYAFFSASWMVGSVVTNDMIQEFGVGHVPSSVNNAISAAKIVGNFVAAWILVKLGPKKTVAFSCLLTCAVIIGALSTSFPFVILSRFLLGFGGAVLMICMTPYVVYCFSPKQQPIFIGINNAGPNTGNLIALFSISAVRAWLISWRSVILFYGLFSVILLVLWLIVGRGYPIAATPKQTDQSAGGKLYRYKDGLREPFLYEFIFTMTGRLVMYTVVLYLFPLHPDFTVNSQFISTMIALTGIPGTIIGTRAGQEAQAPDHPLPLLRLCPVHRVLRDDPDPVGGGGDGVRHPDGRCDLHLHALPLHPAGPDAGGHAAEGRRHYDAVLDGGVYPANDRLRRHRPPGQRDHLEDGHALHRLLLPTFLVGTFLLPDFDKPRTREERARNR